MVEGTGLSMDAVSTINQRALSALELARYLRKIAAALRRVGSARVVVACQAQSGCRATRITPMKAGEMADTI